jgi:DNA topoisomerase VI subunit A
MECVDKSKNVSLAYYDFDTFKRFIKDTQDGNSTYKQFLDEYFGTRIKNKSKIKSKIRDIDFTDSEFISDFLYLKEDQKTKRYTLLKKQLIGLDNILNTSIEIKDNDSRLGINDRTIPCIVEFSVKKNTFKNDTDKKSVDIECYINNSITYHDGWSVGFEEGWYKVGNKTTYARDLCDLLSDMENFSFTFHIISPYLKFTDAGKTRIDISAFFNELLKQLNKVVAKENRDFSSKNKRTNNREVMRAYVTEAFNMASDNGRYAITARQIWYKMRELSGIEEKKNTYNDFTQEILTEWIDENPEFEEKVNFSDRGNFYVGGSQNGLGTANVRNFINTIGTSKNRFECYGGINSDIHINSDFDLGYRYDKVLYIEKTGFDAIFKAEKIGEKYNMIIVSGQGFSTRAAKTLLYEFQKMGMKLYCLHDLDISGIYILDSLGNPNKKFRQSIHIENLGVTLEDVEKYHIVPERVEIKKDDKNKLKNLSDCYKTFFDAGTYYKRVELNAFTTAQILKILDDKLSEVNNLPTINLEESLNINHKAIREIAFMRLVSGKYKEQLESISIPIDLSQYQDKYTVDEAKEEIPEIEEQLILQYEQEIMQKLNIF